MMDNKQIYDALIPLSGLYDGVQILSNNALIVYNHQNTTFWDTLEDWLIIFQSMFIW